MTQHGWQSCRACHHAGHDLRVEGPWHLRANPGYWGASAPKVLVLGFSKGATQSQLRRRVDLMAWHLRACARDCNAC